MWEPMRGNQFGMDFVTKPLIEDKGIEGFRKLMKEMRMIDKKYPNERIRRGIRKVEKSGEMSN
jgi:hypothetical protein